MDNIPQAFYKTLATGLRHAFFLFVIGGILFGIGECIKSFEPQFPYSAFKAALYQGEIQEVQLGTKFLYGTRVVPSPAPVPELTASPTVPLLAPFKTVRVADPQLLSVLRAKNVAYTARADKGWLTNLLPWLFPIGCMLFVGQRLLERMGPNQELLQFGKSRAKRYARKPGRVTFADVAGVDEAKSELQEIVHFLRNPRTYVALGARTPKGVVLVGPPGTGKTLLARAVAGEALAQFLSLSGSDFVEMFAGVGAARVRDLFQQAREQAPAIVFIDELDAVGKKRGASVAQQHDEREQTLNQLLAELDGFDARDGVIILAATNRPEVLDPALLRAGRFDRQVVVDRPDLQERCRILQLHAQQVRLDPTVDLEVIAARTPGMVGADLATVLNEAALLAARHGKATIAMDELEHALDRMQVGPRQQSRVIAKTEKHRIAVHESGHALIASCLPTADPVRKVTIIPHGTTGLGFTLQVPTHDRYLFTQEQLLDRITVLLGGRMAEDLVFGQVSTGAHDDLQKASDLARRMITRFGMSAHLGPYALAGQPYAAFLADDDGVPVMSEATAQAIEQEARDIVERMAKRARQLLGQQRRHLDRLAEYMLQHESIDQETLTRLLDSKHAVIL